MLVALLLSACHESSNASSVAPTAPLASSVSPVGSEVPAKPVSASSAGSASDGGASPPIVAATADAGVTAPATSTIPTGENTASLLDAEGKPLPQTNERPSTSSTAFRARIEAVANAIISGEAEPAFASFFPLAAYQQVKDVAKPERDYKFRLLANFKRDVLEYHHALGAEAAQAKFEGVSVSEKDAKWMEPGSEGNKLGYFRVLRSHLHFTLPSGKTRDFELTSLISWRGEWYVVHLHGFK